MASKPKNQRTFEQTKKYNEYFRKRYAAERARLGKPYTPRDVKVEATKEELDTTDAMKVLAKVVEEKQAEGGS